MCKGGSSPLQLHFGKCAGKDLDVLAQVCVKIRVKLLTRSPRRSTSFAAKLRGRFTAPCLQNGRAVQVLVRPVLCQPILENELVKREHIPSRLALLHRVYELKVADQKNGVLYFFVQPLASLLPLLIEGLNGGGTFGRDIGG